MNESMSLEDAVTSLSYGIAHHGGIFNEDLKVLDGVDPQAWSMIEDSAEVVIAAVRDLLWRRRETAATPDEEVVRPANMTRPRL